ncbi:copper resistance CopC/CopD family protein [Paracoccus sp. NGMCC 1.201697]|uniref:Copper resistance CopC/CopD family protein n=1 Tax=Paracoccus broussonetiae subsp. drimophilus TaxID=3373869 RepID=A0ABW7LLB0_9RHOB
MSRAPGMVAPFLAAVALLLSAAAALAHASLVASDPAEGAVLPQSPPALTLRFTEPVRPLVARLSQADGKTLLLPPPHAGADSLTFSLPPALARGSHLLSWRVTSDDGHPVAGAVLFSVGAPSGEVAAVQEGSSATQAGLWLSRMALLAALLLAVGGGLLAGTPSRFPRRMALAGLLILPMHAGFRGLDLLALPPGALVDGAPWREAVAGAPGLALALTAAALVAALRPGRIAAGIALGLAGLAAATTGHAATAPPQVLMRPTVALHVIAAALWIGALVPLLADLARGRAEALVGFSRGVPWVLALLLGSGGAIALVQLGEPEALWTTPYGRVLLVKLGLVVVLLALAAANRFWLTPRALGGDARPLRRAIGVELLLILPVLGAAALWQFTPPPRSLPPGPATAAWQIQEGPLAVRVEVAPPRAGMVALRLTGIRLDGQPIDQRPVEIELSKPAYGLGPFRHEVTALRGSADGGRFLLPLDGFWVLRLKVLVSDFQAVELSDLIEIAPAR